MMKLQEVADDFIFRHKLQCEEIGRPYKKLNENMVAMLISKGQQDVQRRLGILQKTATLSISSGDSSVNLPDDCGRLRQVFISDTPMVKVSATDIAANLTDTGQPCNYSEIIDNATKKILLQPTADKDYTATIFYIVSPNIFSPSQDPDQDWGQLYQDGKYYGDFKLTDQYEEAVILWGLSRIFANVIPLYAAEIASLRNSYAALGDAKLPYTFGGLRLRAKTRIIQSTSSTTGGDTVTNTDIPSYEYRFEITEGSAAVEKYSKGFGAISVADVGGEITITSNAEFNNFTFVDPNNDNATYEMTNPSTIVIHAGAGYGSLSITIKRYG